MFGLTTFGWLVAFWAAVTVALILALMYKAVVGLHEENQVFLDPAEAAFESEQRAVTARIGQLGGYVRVLGAVSGVLLVTIASWVVVGIVGQFR